MNSMPNNIVGVGSKESLASKLSTKTHHYTIAATKTLQNRQLRFFSRSSHGHVNTQKTDGPHQQTQTFLLSIGYSVEVSDGIINALLQNGIPPNSLLSMVKGLAGRYEVDEDAGLKDLATSVSIELEKTAGKRRVRVTCLPSTGWSPSLNNDDDDDTQQLPKIDSMERAFVVEAIEGTTLTDVAKFGTSDNCDVLGEYLECACSGIMACSTCHVVIHPDWYDDTIPPPPADGDTDNSTDESSNKTTSNKKIGPPSEAEQDMLDLAFEPQMTSRLGCQIKLTKDLDGLVVLLPKGSNNLMDHIPFE